SCTMWCHAVAAPGYAFATPSPVTPITMSSSRRKPALDASTNSGSHRGVIPAGKGGLPRCASAGTAATATPSIVNAATIAPFISMVLSSIERLIVPQLTLRGLVISVTMKAVFAVCVATLGLLSGFVGLSSDTSQAPSSTRTAIDVSKLGPQVGEQVPDFVLKDQTGKMWTRQSIMGPKGAMLVFFRSADR